jgi:DnaJ-class molecular chaperone
MIPEKRPLSTPIPCPDCRGTGLGATRVVKETGNERVLSSQLCTRCRGAGRVGTTIVKAEGRS